MLIYAEKITPRLRYTLGLLLSDAQKPWVLTDDAVSFRLGTGPRLCYHPSDLTQGGGLHIVPTGLLHQTGVFRQQPVHILWKGLPAFVFSSSNHGQFDLLSAVFYLVSRYEEYLPFEADSMGRFEAAQSVAFQMGFLHRPVVDEWRMAWQQEITSRWPDYTFSTPPPRYLSTVDVDHAFAFRHKGALRTLLGACRDLLRADRAHLKQRIFTLRSEAPDPFDTFNQIHQVHQENNAQALFFFLLSDYGRYEKPVNHRAAELRKRIAEVVKHSAVGIHPGVAAERSLGKLKVEKERLIAITGQPVDNARMHFLMLHMPHTYRMLIEAGITHDYTMGYASRTGFRASTSRPYQWFDVQNNHATSLTIHPFAAMDITLNRYMGLSPGDALDEIKRLAASVKKVHGQFITVWHNESLSEMSLWKGWSGLFSQMVKQCASEFEC